MAALAPRRCKIWIPLHGITLPASRGRRAAPIDAPTGAVPSRSEVAPGKNPKTARRSRVAPAERGPRPPALPCKGEARARVLEEPGVVVNFAGGVGLALRHGNGHGVLEGGARLVVSVILCQRCRLVDPVRNEAPFISTQLVLKFSYDVRCPLLTVFLLRFLLRREFVCLPWST